MKNRQRQKRGLRLTGAVALAAVVIAGMWLTRPPGHTPPTPAAPSQAPSAAEFTGSRSCRECHEHFYKLWSTSHHGLAMQPFTVELARDKLQPQQEDLLIRGVRYRAVIENGANHVLERGPQGERRYPIVHVMGGKNVYYLLGPLDRGRLQVLPVAYDVRRKQWYDTTASAMRHFHDNPDEALDWRERPLTFNTSCFNCHVSQLEKNYDPHRDSYHTTWIEPGINCETCHGPCGEHVKLFKQLGPEGARHPPKDVRLIKMSTMPPERRSDTCAPCHAKMVPLTMNFMPGDRYFDHFDLAALEDRDFYPDGRDLGENYTFTLWKLSPGAKNGKFDCVHCHTSSGRDRFAGQKANNACLPCHTTHVADPAAHSHHAAGSEGSKCAACHMPMTEFARMRRSDHSMRPPAPAATLEFKSPNACNICHADKDAAWADSFVRQWYPRDYQAPLLRLGRLVDAARKRDWSKLPEMLDYIARKDRDEIYAGSLIRLLENCDREAKWPVLIKTLQSDPSPWVRARAAEALQGRLDSETVPALVAATRDDTRLVRIRAAASLAGYPVDGLEPADRESVRRAADEFVAHLKSRPDDGASFYNLGNFHMARREYEQAIACFETATRLQADLFAANVNAALAYNAVGRNDRAEAALRRALQLDATNVVANLNLGLLLGELGRVRDAEAAFRTALRSEPRNAVAAYNLAVITGQDGRVEEALELSARAAAAAPQEPKYAYTLAFYQQQQGRIHDAIQTLRRLLASQPAYGAAYALLGELYERQGRRADAAAVYREASENRKLSEQERAQFARRARALEG